MEFANSSFVHMEFPPLLHRHEGRLIGYSKSKLALVVACEVEIVSTLRSASDVNVLVLNYIPAINLVFWVLFM